jgi:hypothetical protein
MQTSERGTAHRPSVPPILPLNVVYRLRDDLTAAVKAAFAKQELDPRTRFHERFRKEADDYDQDFHKKYHDDFNSTLIFVRRYRQCIPDPADKRIGWPLLCHSVSLHR